MEPDRGEIRIGGRRFPNTGLRNWPRELLCTAGPRCISVYTVEQVVLMDEMRTAGLSFGPEAIDRKIKLQCTGSSVAAPDSAEDAAGDASGSYSIRRLLSWMNLRPPLFRIGKLIFLEMRRLIRSIRVGHHGYPFA